MARDTVDVEPVPEDLPGIRGFIARFRADFDSHNHDGANSRRFLTLIAETLSSRTISMRKKSYTDDTSGFWVGLVGNTVKLFLGSASAYLKWTGTALQIAGDIVAGSLTIGSNASIDSSGNATFIGVSSLNKKAYTNFESSTRFTSTVGGTGANTFGNQGVTIKPGATATSYSKLLWFIANAFTNNPTFTFTLKANSLNAASGSARCFAGLGQPTVDGNGITYSGNSYIGVSINKESGVVTVASEMNDGSAGSQVGANLTTIVDNDILEIFIKVTATSVKWYYRKNGGAITLADTQTTHIPTGTGEDSVLFATSNAGTAFDLSLILQCAAYEH